MVFNAAFSAKGGEQIAGNLCRAADGKFTNCGNPDAGDGSSDDIVKSSSMSELVDKMKKRMPGTEFHIEGMEFESAKRACSQLDKLSSKYPSAAKLIKTVLLDDDMSDTVIAAVGWTQSLGDDKAYLALNAKCFSNPEDVKKTEGILKDCEMKGHFPKGCGNIEAIISHEFGHVLQRYLMRSKMANVALVPVIMKIGYSQLPFGTVAGTVQQWNKEQRATGLSKYAMTQKYGDDERRSERWAEAFASMNHTPEKQQGPMAKSMKKMLSVVMDESRYVPAKDVKVVYKDTAEAEEYKGLFAKLREDVGLSAEPRSRKKKKQ